MVQNKKRLNYAYPRVKINIHIKFYIVELEIEAGIQKDSK